MPVTLNSFTIHEKSFELKKKLSYFEALYLFEFQLSINKQYYKFILGKHNKLNRKYRCFSYTLAYMYLYTLDQY